MYLIDRLDLDNIASSIIDKANNLNISIPSNFTVDEMPDIIKQFKKIPVTIIIKDSEENKGLPDNVSGVTTVEYNIWICTISINNKNYFYEGKIMEYDNGIYTYREYIGRPDLEIQAYTGDNISIDITDERISGASSGPYYFYLEDKDNIIQNGKIIKEGTLKVGLSFDI